MEESLTLLQVSGDFAHHGREGVVTGAAPVVTEAWSCHFFTRWLIGNRELIRTDGRHNLQGLLLVAQAP